MSSDLKSTTERVKESITLIKKLKELGLDEREPGYNTIRDHMNEWIKNGTAFKDLVEFTWLDRDAEVTLPTEASKAATIILKIRK
jgi:hypothetical protein